MRDISRMISKMLYDMRYTHLFTETYRHMIYSFNDKGKHIILKVIQHEMKDRHISKGRINYLKKMYSRIEENMIYRFTIKMRPIASDFDADQSYCFGMLNPEEGLLPEEKTRREFNKKINAMYEDIKTTDYIDKYMIFNTHSMRTLSKKDIDERLKYFINHSLKEHELVLDDVNITVFGCANPVALLGDDVDWIYHEEKEIDGVTLNHGCGTIMIDGIKVRVICTPSINGQRDDTLYIIIVKRNK